MSTSHHGDPHSARDAEMLRQQNEKMERLLAQFERKAKRAYPQGRLGAEDEGELAFAIAVDPVKKKVIIEFGKPVQWVGFDVKDAVALAQILINKAKEISTEPIVINV